MLLLNDLYLIYSNTGDEEVLNNLVKQLRKIGRTVINKMEHSLQEDDISSEIDFTIVKILKYYKTGREKLSTYSYRAFKNKFLNLISKEITRYKAITLNNTFSDSEGKEKSVFDNVEAFNDFSEIEREELYKRIMDLKFSDFERTLLKLMIMGYDRKQMCEALNINYNNLRFRISKIRKKIKVLL